MIENIYIIHESGVCLISRTYGNYNKNSDLLSGFLIAISNFARNVIGDEVNEIRMERKNIVYKVNGSLMIAIVLSGRRISRKKTSLLFKELFNSFLESYQEYLAMNVFEPSIFRPFNQVVDAILQNRGIIKFPITTRI